MVSRLKVGGNDAFVRAGERVKGSRAPAPRRRDDATSVGCPGRCRTVSASVDVLWQAAGGASAQRGDIAKRSTTRPARLRPERVPRNDRRHTDRMRVARIEPRSVSASEIAKFTIDADRHAVPRTVSAAAATTTLTKNRSPHASRRVSRCRPMTTHAQHLRSSKAAAAAAVALRPIPIEAIRTGATIAASTAARRDSLGTPTDRLPRATDRTDATHRPAAAIGRRSDHRDQLAPRTGTGQRLASKVERGDLDDVRIGDLRQHLRAVGSELRIEYVFGDRHYRIT